jgi:hypothetical protein
MHSTGGVVGFNWGVSERLLVGAGGGVGSGSLGIDAFGGSSNVTSPRAFAVIGIDAGPFVLRGGGSIGRSTFDSSRRIVFRARLPRDFGGALLTGGIDCEAISSVATTQTDGWGEVAKGADIGRWRLDFVAGVRHARFSREAFVETGAGALSLEAGRETTRLSEGDVKLRWTRRKGLLRPYVSALYRRSTGMPQTTSLWFAGKEDSRFETRGFTSSVGGRG